MCGWLSGDRPSTPEQDPHSCMINAGDGGTGEGGAPEKGARVDLVLACAYPGRCAVGLRDLTRSRLARECRNPASLRPGSRHVETGPSARDAPTTVRIGAPYLM